MTNDFTKYAEVNQHINLLSSESTEESVIIYFICVIRVPISLSIQAQQAFHVKILLQ